MCVTQLWGILHPAESGFRNQFRMRPVPTWKVCVNIVLGNLLIALMTTTYDKVAEISELEWYWQFADLVLQAERTWLGDILKTRQLYRMGEADENGCRPVENSTDGYHRSGTMSMPKPFPAVQIATRKQLPGEFHAPSAPLPRVDMVQSWWYRMELVTDATAAPTDGAAREHSSGGGGRATMRRQQRRKPDRKIRKLEPLASSRFMRM